MEAEGVDERVVRQSIALEIAEIEIPNDPLRGEQQDEASLHIEVEKSENKISVALWDRGEYAGRRSISTSGPGRLIARRIGLAVAELARDLRDRRERAERRMNQEQRFAERRALMSVYRAKQRALGMKVGLRGEALTQGAFLMGPHAGVEFNGEFPLRLSAGLGWSTGWVSALRRESADRHSPPWSKWQLEWGADWVVQPELDTQWSLGLHAGASIVHVGSGAELDQIERQRESYSAQLGIRLAWARQHELGVWPRLEVELGRVLRPLPVDYANHHRRLGGFYVSLGISALRFR